MNASSEQPEKRTYKKTLNLPKTSFAMKASLVQREPEFQKRWDRIDLYRRWRDMDHPQGPFAFHDGPPYANGDIHLGHLLNKVLKDMVVRSKTMLGYDVDFVPGWDCHGLPIEHRVMQELGDKARDMVAMQIRQRCQQYAAKFQKTQAKQMQRLGTTGNYDAPYLTMTPDYEAATLEVFAEMVGKDLVYRALKPVHWSIANQTALAEAELEYEDREDTSIYVKFPLNHPQALPEALNTPADARIDLLIWTTTPWTLPANLAVAVSPHSEYGLYQYEQQGTTQYMILAKPLVQQVMTTAGLDPAAATLLGECIGNDLADASLTYRHPFLDDQRTRPLVTADYVTMEDGTGMVHTAPGHGVEDYQTGLRVGLDIYCPVLPDGTFDHTAPDWLRGVDVWAANEKVIENLRHSGHLFHDNKFMHSYPHDWRSKTPTIFRATHQWFVGVERPLADQGGQSLRKLALQQAGEAVRFIPEQGRSRMLGMLETRPDWCISRQRSWGLPIPAFFGPQADQYLLTPASVMAVAKKLRNAGSDIWYKAEPAELLADYDPQQDPDAPDWMQHITLDALKKSGDIFDVWFESGSSWHAVMRQRDLGFPVDLYLEGSDQHRGWFQLSLLPGIAVTGQAPFRALLTHGFIVDAQGKKMSKSLGNTIDVQELLTRHGADVCRWWAASLNYSRDVKVDWAYFDEAGDSYRKVRNTIRFLLSNLNDFTPDQALPLTADDATSLDAWVLGELKQLIQQCRQGYEAYDYRAVHNAVFNFCNHTLSAVYLAAVKDRMYCDAPATPRRRRAQTVMHHMADVIIRLSAPILVHTADEAYLALHGGDMKDERSVHLQPMPTIAELANLGLGEIEGHDAAWQAVMQVRDAALKALEDARSQRDLDNPLDVGLEVMVPGEMYARVQPMEAELADLCGVSRFELIDDGQMTVQVNDLRDEPRCERSWKRDGTVKQRSDGGMLTDRDAQAVSVQASR